MCHLLYYHVCLFFREYILPTVYESVQDINNHQLYVNISMTLLATSYLLLNNPQYHHISRTHVM